MYTLWTLICLLGAFTPSNGAGGASGGHGSDKTNLQGEFDSWSRVSYGGEHFISEGSPFDIVCTLSVFDQLKWTLNGSPIQFESKGYTVAEIPAPQGFLGSRLSVAKSQKEHAGDYKCTTFSPLSHSIYILSGESGSSTESTKLLHAGHPMPLECKIVHDPEVQLALNWYKDEVPIGTDNERYKIFAENSTLLIIKASQEDIGVYTCQTVDVDPPKQFEVSVVYLTYKNLPKSLTVLEGDKLSISCDVDGNPSPQISWFKDKKNVEDVVNNTRFTLEPNGNGIENATFLIEEAIYDDRAEYSCFINVADLQFNTTTFVRIKDMYAALWPFLGICVEVFILCLIIFIYEKRRAKADFEESDTDQPTEQKSSSDQNKDSIRHRK